MSNIPLILKADVLIIGAGPSGALAASFLRQADHSVCLFERSSFPRFSIGESLLPQSMVFFEKAGVLPKIQAANFQRKKGAVFQCGARHSDIDFSNKFTKGPAETFEVQRADFDKILADHAQNLGAEIHYEHTVTSYEESKEGVILRGANIEGEPYEAHGQFVLDASGYGRVLPRLLDLEKPSDFPVRKAIFSHIKDGISHPNFDRDKILITIHATNPNIWYWLIPFSNGTASIGVVGETAEIDAFGSTDEERLNSLIKQDRHYQTIMPDFSFTRPITSMIGYSCSVKSLYGKNFALLGNAGEFLDPVFSSGLTIAAKSADLAVEVLLKQLAGQTVNWEKDFAAPLMVGVNAFRDFVESWYKGPLQRVILNQQEENSEIKKMIISMLAGYAWDENNAFVKRGKHLLNIVSESL
jgi:flavin-dependent dehydrogenase